MLDTFVQVSDERGGPNSPGCNAYWSEFTYKPSIAISEAQDPFGPEYMAAQLGLYQELSGRSLDQDNNEHTCFDMPAHVGAANPYGPYDPAAAALHIMRLSRAIIAAKPRFGAKVLDMGCGWGLSSEFAAYLGMDVTGVDINPDFVSLVNQRAARQGTHVRAIRSTFDDYVPDFSVDLILFYECLHHAVRPWTVIERLARNLAPDGAIVLAGEPINDVWRNWGLRLDALSVYCIRKFGWFESGWSLAFIKSVFERAGMRVEAEYDAVSGYTLVARPIPATQAALAQIAQGCSSTGWLLERDHLVLQGDGSLAISFPEGADSATLDVRNYRGQAVALRITYAEQVFFDGSVGPGVSMIAIPRLAAMMSCNFKGEMWSPDAELGNGDQRSISIHLAGVSFT
jgi:SAM-dependent methyltransferase